MIISMTGFGSAQADGEGFSCGVEIRAVNNRFLKAVIKLPDKLSALEPDVDKVLRDNIGRGSIVCAVTIKDARGADSVAFNRELMDVYVAELTALNARIAQKDPSVKTNLDLTHVLTLPGVCEAGDDSADYLEKHREQVLALIKEACVRLSEMRKREGDALWKDLQKHLAVIHGALGNIKKQAPLVSKEYHEKLRARVMQMVSDAKLSLSDQDLLREVALFTDRADISEEISRLTGHLEQFEAVSLKEEQAGRKLDFISQEMLREANTIASKANDAQIARWTVDIKSSIDRIKEQVQNVE